MFCKASSIRAMLRVIRTRSRFLISPAFLWRTLSYHPLFLAHGDSLLSLALPLSLSTSHVVLADACKKVLLMGQSNMSGRGQGYDRAIDGPNNPRIKQWSRANTIVTAEEHLQHHDSSGSRMDKNVGMGTAFGRAYVETLPEQRDVLLVPTAHGGTALVNGPWSPGGYLFEDAVTRMEAALASNEADGNCVAAVLWHQGENDARRHVDQDAYLWTWMNMIETLRRRIPTAAEAPVVLGEFAEPWVENNAELVEPVLEAIRDIPDTVAFTALADADDLSVNPGQEIHFDAAGQREFGERYFDKLRDAIRNDAARETRLEGGKDTPAQRVAAVA